MSNAKPTSDSRYKIHICDDSFPILNRVQPYFGNPVVFHDGYLELFRLLSQFRGNVNLYRSESECLDGYGLILGCTSSFS